jgi:nicotinate-nucleotide adenylyltransferase
MLGILGGTFDPIHYGHLSAAAWVYQTLALNELRFMPCHYPPHREMAKVSTVHRLNMLKLAIEHTPGFVIDERELKTDAISYTVHSLEQIRSELGNTPICLLIGRETFGQLPTWHTPERLLELAHLVVVNRPSQEFQPHVFIDELMKKVVQDPLLLKQKNAGSVYFADNPLLEISSTLIRQTLAQGINPQFLLPDKVLAYINHHGLYT